MTEALREFWEERAAAREYLAGASRDEAEALAVGDVAIAYGWPAAVGLGRQGEESGRHSG